jgi:Zn ribbon nucleic-acid-binding protein
MTDKKNEPLGTLDPVRTCPFCKNPFVDACVLYEDKGVIIDENCRCGYRRVAADFKFTEFSRNL